MRVWVTRTLPGALKTAARLRALGHDPVVEPLFEIRLLAAGIDLGGVAALAFTSRHGVDAFAARTRERALPVFAVGDATADAARSREFVDVRSAAGDVARLAELIVAARPNGVVLHAAALERAGDLEGALRSAGIETRTVAVYETLERAWIEPERYDAVLVQSPRAGRTLAARLGKASAALFACVSSAAAAPLTKAGFAAVRTAAAPVESATLALLPRTFPGLAERGPAV
jgi:uroporphyrinogen-III synthase